jgi:hypothetical protein
LLKTLHIFLRTVLYNRKRNENIDLIRQSSQT